MRIWGIYLLLMEQQIQRMFFNHSNKNEHCDRKKWAKDTIYKKRKRESERGEREINRQLSKDSKFYW